MNIHLDSHFTSLPASADRTATQARLEHRRVSHISHAAFSQSRADREALFEHNHGSLWEPGLLDRLTSPLTRYHE